MKASTIDSTFLLGFAVGSNGWQPSLGWPRGQVEDWRLSLDDGSCLHLLVFPDGSTSVHRDAIDPTRGPLPLFLHLALETPLALIVGVALIVLS